MIRPFAPAVAGKQLCIIIIARRVVSHNLFFIDFTRENDHFVCELLFGVSKNREKNIYAQSQSSKLQLADLIGNSPAKRLRSKIKPPFSERL